VGKLSFFLVALSTIVCGCINYSAQGLVQPVFIVSDVGNNRVLVWKNGSGPFAASPDLVLGQPNFSSNSPGSSQATFNTPNAYWDGTHLLVADFSNNRVLIWKSLPTSNQQPADLVLGQPDFNQNAPNNGGISASSLKNPIRAWSDGVHLMVSDWANLRVLGWRSFPTTINQPADFVLGQTNFSGSAFVCNSYGVGPVEMAYDGRFYIVDDGGARIMIWNALPQTTGQPADVVLGEPNMNTCVNGIGASGVGNPFGITLDSKHVAIADWGNHRVLIWNSKPTVNGQPADVVVGQASMMNTAGVCTAAGLTAANMCLAWGVTWGPGLFVSDGSNNRIMVWNSWPTTNGQPADYILGQPSSSSFSPGLSPTTYTTNQEVFSNLSVPGLIRPGGY